MIESIYPTKKNRWVKPEQFSISKHVLTRQVFNLLGVVFNTLTHSILCHSFSSWGLGWILTTRFKSWNIWGWYGTHLQFLDSHQKIEALSEPVLVGWQRWFRMYNPSVVRKSSTRVRGHIWLHVLLVWVIVIEEDTFECLLNINIDCSTFSKADTLARVGSWT